MKILVIGSGGREHALCWKLGQTLGVEVFASPGNPGMALVGTCVAPEQVESLEVDLTVVGPEAPLVDGIVDRYRELGRPILGPLRDAAQLEGSKIFAKRFMQQRGIPTAAFVTVDSPEEALRELDRFGFPVVLKADGLAAGKGVVVAQDRAEAEAALSHFKGRLVVEEFLRGEEVSFIALCDGKNVIPLAPTQDHKTVFDGDQGPNTGGMGAYCDSAILTDDQTGEILERIIYPTVRATGFTGFLYAGLMITESGPKVVEFNVRLGDPETQALLHRLSSNFADVLVSAAAGDLAGGKLEWRNEPSVCVVLASGGYPGHYATGIPIEGVEAAEVLGAAVFHAGTRKGADGFETAGGRVLGVTNRGADLREAIERTYSAVEQIRFGGMHYRRDIGRKGLARSRG